MTEASAEFNRQEQLRETARSQFHHDVEAAIREKPTSQLYVDAFFDGMSTTMTGYYSEGDKKVKEMGFNNAIELLAYFLHESNLPESIAPTQRNITETQFIGLEEKPKPLNTLFVTGPYGWDSSRRKPEEKAFVLYLNLLKAGGKVERVCVQRIDLGTTREDYLAGKAVSVQQDTATGYRRLTLQMLTNRDEATENPEQREVSRNHTLETLFRTLPESGLDSYSMLAGLPQGFADNFVFEHVPHRVDVEEKARQLRMLATPFFAMEATPDGIAVGVPNRSVVPFAYALEQRNPVQTNNAYVGGEHIFSNQANSTSGLSALVEAPDVADRAEYRSAHYQVMLDSIFQLFNGDDGRTALTWALNAQNQLQTIGQHGQEIFFRSAHRYHVDDAQLEAKGKQGLFVYRQGGMGANDVRIEVDATVERMLAERARAQADLRAGNVSYERMEEIARLGERFGNFVNLTRLVEFIHDQQ